MLVLVVLPLVAWTFDPPLDYYSRQIAYVTQDNYLLMKRLWKIFVWEFCRFRRRRDRDCSQVWLLWFHYEIENGFETRVGTGGGHLSGGERQRIAIARAMLKTHQSLFGWSNGLYWPRKWSSHSVYLARLIEGRTLLVIAHRLSTIASANQIVVVNDGLLRQKGISRRLQKTCPLYASMWQILQ